MNDAGVPEPFARWLRTMTNASFQDDTTTPVQPTRTYVEYLSANSPLGGLEIHPINIFKLSQILGTRQSSLLKLFQMFLNPKFGAYSPLLHMHMLFYMPGRCS